MKKIIATFVCCSLVLSMFLSLPLVVSADYTARYSDGFENNSGSIVSSNGKHYVSSGDNGLFIHPGTKGHNTYADGVRITPGVGYNNSTGLELFTNAKSANGNYRSTSVLTRGITLGANDAVLLRYKIKVLEHKADFVSFGMLTGKNGDGLYASRASFKIVTNDKFDTDKWYTVVLKVSGATATKNVSGYILKEDGTIFKSSTTVSSITIGVDSANTEATQPVHIWPFFSPAQAKSNSVIIDDVTLTQYSTASTQNIGLDATGSDIANGATNVLLNRSFTLAFDHDLASGGENAVKLYKKSNPTELLSYSIVNQTKTFNSFTLQPDAALEAGTEYVLDISAVTSAQGQTVASGAGTISFTTVEPELAEPIAFVSATGSTAGNFVNNQLANAALNESVTLTFDKPVADPGATGVVLYKTADAAKTPVAAEITRAGEKSITISPSKTLGLNTNYTVDFSGVVSEEGGELTGTSSVVFTTIASRSMINIQDDFSSAPVGSINSYQGDIIANTCKGNYSIADGVGYAGTRGIKLNTNGQFTNNLQSEKFELDETEKLYVEFKMNTKSFTMNDASDHGMRIGIISGSATTIHNSWAVFSFKKASGNCYLYGSGSTKISPDPDEFYTVILEARRNSIKGYLYNEAGDLVLTNTLSKTLEDSVYFIAATVATFEPYAVMNFDDFKIFRVQNDALAIDAARSNIADGETNVAVAGVKKLVFNQPLATGAEDLFSLTCGGEAVPATIKRVGGNEIHITPAGTLKQGRTYTVNFTGLGALSANAFSGSQQLAFTTKMIYNVNAMSSNLEVSSDGTVASGSKTVLVDNVGAKVEDAVLVISIYSEDRPRRLIGWEMVTVDTINANSETGINFTLSKDYSNVGSVELFLYNSISSIHPLMKAYKITK